MNENNTFSYSDAIAELNGIMTKLQSDACDIDSMVALTRRASELIRQCRQRLVATEQELKDVLDTLQQPE